MTLEVKIKLDEAVVGRVEINTSCTDDQHDQACLEQAAATAWESLRTEATFEVGGETFTADDCSEWFA